MEVPFAYSCYGNALKHAAAVESFSIDKSLCFGPAVRGDDPQAADVCAAIVTMERPRKENKRILLPQIRTVTLLVLSAQGSRVWLVNAIDRPEHRNLRSSSCGFTTAHSPAADAGGRLAKTCALRATHDLDFLDAD